MARGCGMDRVIKAQYKKGYQDGLNIGIRLMEEQMLLAHENGVPLEVKGRAWWIQSDIDNLKNIMDDLEGEKADEY